MHPVFTQTLAAERVRDMRARAIASERARLARSTRPVRRFSGRTSSRLGRPLRARGAAAGCAPATHAAARHAG